MGLCPEPIEKAGARWPQPNLLSPRLYAGPGETGAPRAIDLPRARELLLTYIVATLAGHSLSGSCLRGRWYTYRLLSFEKTKPFLECLVRVLYVAGPGGSSQPVSACS